MNRTSTKTVLSNAVLVWRVFKILKRNPAALTRYAGTCRCALEQLDTNIAEQFGSGEYVAGGYPNGDPINWKEEPVSTQMCLIKNGEGKKWELDRQWIQAVCCSEKPEECAGWISGLVSIQESLKKILDSGLPKLLKQKSKRGRKRMADTDYAIKLTEGGMTIEQAAIETELKFRKPGIQEKFKRVIQQNQKLIRDRLHKYSERKDDAAVSDNSSADKPKPTKKKAAPSSSKRQIATNSSHNSGKNFSAAKPKKAKKKSVSPPSKRQIATNSDGNKTAKSDKPNKHS